MPSYISYKNNLKAILDADDTEIESWITVRGNHIPIKKGQSKEEAVKSFIESKGGEYKKESYGKHYVKYGEGENKKYVSPRNDLIYRDKSRAGFFGSEKEAKEYAEKLNHTDPYAGTEFAVKNYKRTVLPYEVESEEKESYSYKGEEIEIEKAPNGKFFVNYGVGKSPSTAGGFNTKEEAQAALKKHRPDAKKAEKEHKDPFATKTKENHKNEIINGQTHFTYTDPDGLNFRVTESSNDPGWKSSNLPTESFKSKEEAITASKERLKSDKLKYGDFSNKRNKEYMFNVYKKGFAESEPEMGDPHEAQRLSGIEKPKTEKHKDLRSAFGKHYDKLYNDHDLDDKSGYLLDEWDKHIQDPKFKKAVQEFVQERGDFISSDREVKAFMLAAKETGLIPQEKKPAKKKETIADVFEKYKSTSINNHEEWNANYEKMQKAINKEYTVENVQNWTASREGISFGASDYGEYGTNAKITVSKNLKDLLLSLPEHKQKDVIKFIRVHSGRPYSSEHIDPYQFMKALKNGKESNGKTTIDIETTTYGWFDD